MNLSDAISSVFSNKIEKLETLNKNKFNIKNEDVHSSNANPQKTFNLSTIDSGKSFSIPSFNC